MNIITNFDLENAIYNVNRKLTPLKIIKNNKVIWAKINLPVYTALDYIIADGDIKTIGGILLSQFGLSIAIVYMLNSSLGVDFYQMISERDLRDLLKSFKDSEINTSFDLLKKSEVYEKKYNVRLNEKKLPELVQSTYILVPTYDSFGDVKDTSVLQEHVMGDDEYILSFGKPQKVLKPSFSNI